MRIPEPLPLDVPDSTCNLAFGEVVPMPTKPFSAIVNFESDKLALLLLF